MHFSFEPRLALLTTLFAAGLAGQSFAPASIPGADLPKPATTLDSETKSGVAPSTGASSTGVSAINASADSKSTEIQPDLSDPAVVRARQSMDRIRALVTQGVLPPFSLVKAQDDLNDALDMSILRYSALAQDLLPEQADQMVSVAQRMLLRRQRRSIQNAQLAATGVISRSEAAVSEIDVTDARLQLDLAIERANLARDLAQQKALAEVETEAESHPEWNGKLYTRYDGNGIFTRADFVKISAAYLATFGHAIPVSADGQTAVHRSMGFDHTGRIDIALSPDQREGAWLLRYLEKNHIPYYAFKAAVAHKATGAHIHLGPGSTKLVLADEAGKVGNARSTVVMRTP